MIEYDIMKKHVQLQKSLAQKVAQPNESWIIWASVAEAQISQLPIPTVSSTTPNEFFKFHFRQPFRAYFSGRYAATGAAAH